MLLHITFYEIKLYRYSMTCRIYRFSICHLRRSMPHRGGGRDRENRTETVFNANQYINICGRGKTQSSGLMSFPPTRIFHVAIKMTRFARCMGARHHASGKRISYDEPCGPLSLRDTLYIPYTQPGELTVLRSGEVTDSRRGLSSLYFYFTQIPQLS